jgi:hypothetical protein
MDVLHVAKRSLRFYQCNESVHSWPGNHARLARFVGSEKMLWQLAFQPAIGTMTGG